MHQSRLIDAMVETLRHIQGKNVNTKGEMEVAANIALSTWQTGHQLNLEQDSFIHREKLLQAFWYILQEVNKCPEDSIQDIANEVLAKYNIQLRATHSLDIEAYTRTETPLHHAEYSI